MKILQTGVIIAYDKKGNVDRVTSPYWQDEKTTTTQKIKRWILK